MKNKKKWGISRSDGSSECEIFCQIPGKEWQRVNVSSNTGDGVDINAIGTAILAGLNGEDDRTKILEKNRFMEHCLERIKRISSGSDF